MGNRRHSGLRLLLGLFVAVGVAALAYEVQRRADVPRHEIRPAIPHGPGEFPKLFAFDPLRGLDEATDEINVPPPPLSRRTWPCSECHRKEPPNPVRRKLVDAHSHIELRHDEENRWCLDCHDLEDRDRLRLANGELIGFEESYRLCGQCHGTVYRDWRAGIHGRRMGYWDGPKRYLLCVHCHWPHAPAFPGIRPLPPPVRPEAIGLDLVRSGEVEPEANGGSRGKGKKK